MSWEVSRGWTHFWLSKCVHILGGVFMEKEASELITERWVRFQLQKTGEGVGSLRAEGPICIKVWKSEKKMQMCETPVL